MAASNVLSDTSLQGWLDAEPHAVAWVGPEGHYHACNAAMRRLLGDTEAEPRGLSRAEVLTHLLCPRLLDAAALTHYLGACAAGDAHEVCLTLCEAGSEGRVWQYESRVVRGPDGALVGWREALVDVTETHRLRGECAEQLQHLEALRDDIEARLQRRDQFIARVSHELRTPMTAVIGFCHMLLSYSGDLSSVQQTYVHKVLKNASILLQLINNVLDISKINSGAVSVMRENVELGAIVSEAVETVEPQTWEKSLPIHVDVDPTLPTLVTDRLKLKQVIINLLANAVKYTDVGQVELRAALEDGGVGIHVIDTGIGIPAGDRERIFEAYIQVDEARRNRLPASTGLGLTISRRLTELLGGRLSVESELGEGSVFTLWLPLVLEQLPEDELPLV